MTLFGDHISGERLQQISPFDACMSRTEHGREYRLVVPCASTLGKEFNKGLLP